MNLRKKAWVEPALLFAGFAAVTLFVVIFPPGTSAIYPRCMFNGFTGWLCPGCGGTRALHALTSGDIARAFLLNPLIFAVPVYLALRLLTPAREALQRFEQRRGSTLGLIIFLIAFTVIRNSTA